MPKQSSIHIDSANITNSIANLASSNEPATPLTPLLTPGSPARKSMNTPLGLTPKGRGKHRHNAFKEIEGERAIQASLDEDMKCAKWLQTLWLYPLLKLTHPNLLARSFRSSLIKKIVIDDNDGQVMKTNVDDGKQNQPVSEWRLPSSTFRAHWETVNFSLYCLNSLLVPFRIVFGVREGFVESDVVKFLGVFIQLMFFADFYLRMRKFCCEEQVSRAELSCLSTDSQTHRLTDSQTNPITTKQKFM